LANVKDAGAENLTQVILEQLKDCGEVDENTVKEKLVGFGADGASVNMGSQNGIGVRLRQLQPSLTIIHCMAHRLELAFKDEIDQKNMRPKFRILPFLEGIYSFYHRSSKNRSGLSDCARQANVSGTPTRIGGTRWVSHLHTALVNFWKLQPALKIHLAKVNKLFYF
jgi:hypothetical protein